MRLCKLAAVFFLLISIFLKVKDFQSQKQLKWTRKRIIELQEEISLSKSKSCDVIEKELSVYRQLNFSIVSKLLMEVECSKGQPRYAFLFWDDAVCSSCSHEEIESFLKRMDDSNICNFFVLNNFDEKEEMIFRKRHNLIPISTNENMNFEYPFVVIFNNERKQVEKVIILENGNSFY